MGCAGLPDPTRLRAHQVTGNAQPRIRMRSRTQSVWRDHIGALSRELSAQFRLALSDPTCISALLFQALSGFG